MFVSSEFDIFSRKTVQESILETLGVVYKPIASVYQSDLEFLIPADNETYIDPDIKIYVRGKLTKIDGSALDENDFTAVRNNFLHSLLSQCAVSLNGTMITQATELYTRAVPKLMPPILLCWLTTSEANIVDMAVEVEPSRQYSVKFCCRATDDSRGAV